MLNAGGVDGVTLGDDVRVVCGEICITISEDVMDWLDVILTVMFCHCCDISLLLDFVSHGRSNCWRGTMRCVLILGMAFCYDVGVTWMIYGVK
jgi:hypothetical protein